ncbi:SCO3374 family protein [Streptomyces sp. NPDC002889]|uniref:SCO3374 family protein n=1 Tax=Streptomyces sp. NPDC002889 TaxID=3364669 RepID=UPI0036A9A868
MAFTVPVPRTPLESAGTSDSGSGTAQWYASELGWPVTEETPVQLLTGLRFDVLELPADAGSALLRRPDVSADGAGPVALMGPAMRLLVAAGSAEELPGLLDWLEWGGIDLDLTAIGAGGRIAAPPPPGRPCARGAAVWLRPPVPGREAQLPALTGLGDIGGAPGLVQLVDAAATECHRARLLRSKRTNTRRTKTQPLAFS